MSPSIDRDVSVCGKRVHQRAAVAGNQQIVAAVNNEIVSVVFGRKKALIRPGSGKSERPELKRVVGSRYSVLNRAAWKRPSESAFAPNIKIVRPVRAIRRERTLRSVAVAGDGEVVGGRIQERVVLPTVCPITVQKHGDIFKKWVRLDIARSGPVALLDVVCGLLERPHARGRAGLKWARRSWGCLVDYATGPVLNAHRLPQNVMLPEPVHW